jgi:hypothetical protein
MITEEVFAEFAIQHWDSHTKLQLLMEFFDNTASLQDEVEFQGFLQEVANAENAYTGPV